MSFQFLACLLTHVFFLHKSKYVSISKLCVSIDVHSYLVQIFACQKKKTCKNFVKHIHCKEVIHRNGIFSVQLTATTVKRTLDNKVQTIWEEHQKFSPKSGPSVFRDLDFAMHDGRAMGLTKFPWRALHVSGSDARFGWCHFSDPPHFGPLATFFGFFLLNLDSTAPNYLRRPPMRSSKAPPNQKNRGLFLTHPTEPSLRATLVGGI